MDCTPRSVFGRRIDDLLVIQARPFLKENKGIDNFYKLNTKYQRFVLPLPSNGSLFNAPPRWLIQDGAIKEAHSHENM